MAATARREHQVGSSTRTKPEPDPIVADDETPVVSLYDALRENLRRSVTVQEVAYDVPTRPDMSMVFGPAIEFETYQAWMKKAEDRKTKEVDFLKLSITVISNTNTGIKLNGQLVTHPESGDPLRITSREVHEFLGVPVGSTGAAIRKLYGLDGHVIQTCRNVVEKAGYSMEGDVLEADEDGPLVH